MMNTNKAWLIGLMALLTAILIWYHHKDMLIPAVQVGLITKYGFSRITPRLLEELPPQVGSSSVPSCVNLPWYYNPYYYTVAFGTFVVFVTLVSLLVLISYYRYRYARLNRKARDQKLYLQWKKWNTMFNQMMSPHVSKSNTNNQRDLDANHEQYEMVSLASSQHNSSSRDVSQYLESTRL